MADHRGEVARVCWAAAASLRAPRELAGCFGLAGQELAYFALMMSQFYPIGTPGQAWSPQEVEQWQGQQKVQRSYKEEVLDKIEALSAQWEVISYGALPKDPAKYPLKALRCQKAGAGKPWIVITGGVHGYETSGVKGALACAERLLGEYADRANLLVAPCVSPWGYEVVQRWNPEAVDPNRSFRTPAPAMEAKALMELAASLPGDILVHMDLHETTDTDESEFRPALAAKDGKAFEPCEIPDGFYTVADANNVNIEFQKAVIAGVEPVTHIAPADANGQLIGSDILERGIIAYPYKEAGLCGGLTTAKFTTTTEVYPDSPKASPELCIEAQVAAVKAGLAFVFG